MFAHTQCHHQTHPLNFKGSHPEEDRTYGKQSSPKGRLARRAEGRVDILCLRMDPAEQGRIFLWGKENSEPLPSHTTGPTAGAPCLTTPFAPATAPRPTNPRPTASRDTKVTVRRRRRLTAHTTPHPRDWPRCRAAMPGAPPTPHSRWRPAGSGCWAAAGTAASAGRG